MESDLSPTLVEKLNPLKRLFQNDPRVLGVWLFGSQADGTASGHSDIDLAVLFNRELSLREELDFEVEVSEVLHIDNVDVVNLRNANLLLRFRAIAGDLLYERDFARVADFVEQTLIEYRDFEPRARAILRDYLVTW